MTLSTSLQALDLDDSIQLEQDSSILYLWLNRPESRNAMNLNMVNAIQQVFAAIRDDLSIRAVIIRGEGGAFVQVGILKTWLPYELKQLMSAVYNLMLTLTAVLVPCLSKLKLHHRLLWSF